MNGLLWFSLLFLSASAAESMTKANGCLSQPSRVIWKKSGQSVVLSCTSHCREPGVYEWFLVRENTHHRLNLLGSQKKYNLTGTSLHIKSLQGNDSGIYHCAWHGEPTHDKPHVALGTTLVVREKGGVMVLNILLWLSFVLLAIYSLTLTTFIIKKYGCVCCGIRKTLKNTSTKRRHFSDVLQEIDRRNNQKRSKRAANFNEPTDDIYQNI